MGDCLKLAQHGYQTAARFHVAARDIRAEIRLDEDRLAPIDGAQQAFGFAGERMDLLGSGVQPQAGVGRQQRKTGDDRGQGQRACRQVAAHPGRFGSGAPAAVSQDHDVQIQRGRGKGSEVYQRPERNDAGR